MSGSCRRSKGRDPSYAKIKTEQLALYQHYVDKVIDLVDLDNNTEANLGRSYDREQLTTDDKTMETIMLEEAAKEGLEPVYLQAAISADISALEATKGGLPAVAEEDAGGGGRGPADAVDVAGAA